MRTRGNKPGFELELNEFDEDDNWLVDCWMLEEELDVDDEASDSEDDPNAELEELETEESEAGEEADKLVE